MDESFHDKVNRVLKGRRGPHGSTLLMHPVNRGLQLRGRFHLDRSSISSELGTESNFFEKFSPGGKKSIQ